MALASLSALSSQSADTTIAALGTRAERSNYEETSTYDDVMRLVRGIVSSSALAKYESYGKTEEGREMPLLMLSEPAVTTPEAAHKLGRPIVFVQANIHAGEVEGKEASLILARSMTQGDLRPLLKQLDETTAIADRRLAGLVARPPGQGCRIEQQDQVHVRGIVKLAAAELAQRQYGETARLFVRHTLEHRRTDRVIHRRIGKVGQGRRDPLERPFAADVRQRHRQCQAMALAAQPLGDTVAGKRQGLVDGGPASVLDKAVGDLGKCRDGGPKEGCIGLRAAHRFRPLR